MANEDHLKILKQGVEVWNLWREANAAIVPDLSGETLLGLNLNAINLASSDLTAVNFGGGTAVSDVVRAAMSGADFIAGRRVRADDYEHLSTLAKMDCSLLGADLREASLLGTNFDWVDLSGSDLSEAHAHSASFMQSNLSDASLEKAHLVMTSFRNADLRGAQLAGARIANVTFAGLDLSETTGLGTVEHSGRSSLSWDTLVLSQGRIPESFLRGCGIDEALIAALPSLLGQGIEFLSCFISYSHEDKPFARRLYDQLQGRGIRCWLDEHDIKPGQRILDVVNQAIRVQDRLLLCCTKSSLSSWWVKDEIRKAQDRERKEKRDIIIPLNLDGYLLEEWDDGLASDLTSRLAADFTGWEHDNAKFKEQFEAVVRALRADEAAGW